MDSVREYCTHGRSRRGDNLLFRQGNDGAHNIGGSDPGGGSGLNHKSPVSVIAHTTTTCHPIRLSEDPLQESERRRSTWQARIVLSTVPPTVFSITYFVPISSNLSLIDIEGTRLQWGVLFSGVNGSILGEPPSAEEVCVDSHLQIHHGAAESEKSILGSGASGAQTSGTDMARQGRSIH